MVETTLKTRIVHKHDTEAHWLLATNFIPKQGEIIVYDIDENYTYERFKIGDGKTVVSVLPFTVNPHSHINATTDNAGLMSAEDKAKLDGIEVGANKITIDTMLSSTSTNPVQNKVLNAAITSNYNESIIGLSVDGQTVTYIKGDGSTHSFTTQDTNTTYSLGTDEVTGLTKLYATTGSAEDGTMTQKAIKTELDKKVGVSIDSANSTLVFTI